MFQPLKAIKNHLHKLKYRVKYFPEDVEEELFEDVTVRYFFLQVKAAILQDAIYCPPETCVLLASYALQAKYGDYDAEEFRNGFFSKHRCLPERYADLDNCAIIGNDADIHLAVIVSDKSRRMRGLISALFSFHSVELQVPFVFSFRVYNQHNMDNETWEANIINLWKKHGGMQKGDAMMEYLKLAQNLEMYGVTYFNIKNKKGSDILLGVTSLGLNIYKVEDK